MNKTVKCSPVSLGELQKAYEFAAQQFRAKTRALKKARDEHVSAEEAYHAAQKALQIGAESVIQSSKTIGA